MSILTRLGSLSTADDFPALDLTPDPDADRTDDDDPPLGDDSGDTPTPEVGDNYISSELLFPRNGTLAKGKVTARKRDSEGNPIGRAHQNPILDTRQYLVEFEDGDVTELTANSIAENMYSQCDIDGNQYLLLDTFVDFRKTNKAISLDMQKWTDKTGRVRQTKSTIGWQLCCQWRDGSTSWQDLSLLKESHPIQTAEFAVAQGIDAEPAFNWWVPHTLKKRAAIIKLARSRNARYLKKTHKFGIELPKSVVHALELDRQNGNTLWADAIAKEMKDV